MITQYQNYTCAVITLANTLISKHFPPWLNDFQLCTMPGQYPRGML